MKTERRKAQAIIEFTFAMIVVFLMIFGAMMIFRWTGLDFAFRRKAHDSELTQGISHHYTQSDGRDGPLKQISPYFYQPTKMNAVWKGGP